MEKQKTKEMKRGKYETQTKLRNQDLLEHFEVVENSYGEHKKYIPKMILYEEAAVKFRISGSYAATLIRKMLKNGI